MFYKKKKLDPDLKNQIATYFNYILIKTNFLNHTPHEK